MSELLDVRVIGAPEVAGRAVARLAELLLDLDRESGPYPSRKTPGLVRCYLTGRLRPEHPACKVEPEAALALLEVAARELRRAAEDLGARVVPHSILFLANDLEHACQWRQVDAFTVELAYQGAYQARRCDLADAFKRLNPEFDEIHRGCWPSDLSGDDRRRQQRAQRRELELSIGERFARMLAPACQGGEAA
jgi:hypothetical protein